MRLSNTLRQNTIAQATELPTEILEISAQLFPGPLQLDHESDPESPGERFLVLTVRASGSPRELVERRREWHRRVSEVLPDMSIRLAITSAVA